MAKMPPPGGDGPGVAIVIGTHGDKPGGKMAPPGTPDKPQGSGKASPEEAGVVKADAHCIDCQNYAPDTGACSAVDGTYDPDDACSKYFQPVADDDSGEEPDADDAAGEGPPPQGPA
jgi:hypothetical protein